MRTRLTLSLVSMALILGACAARISAADVFDNPAWQKEISMDVTHVKVAQALDALMRDTGIRWSIDPDIGLIPIPKVQFRNVPLLAAFKSLIKTCGLTYQVDGDRIVMSGNPGIRNVWLTHVSIEANDATLGQAIGSLFRDTGINYVLDPGAADLHVKSLKVHDATLYEALDTVLDNADAKSFNAIGVTYIVPKSAPTRQASPESSNVNVSMRAGDGDPWQRRLDIEVTDARLNAVVVQMFKPAKFNFSIDRDAVYLAVHSLKLTDVTLREALDAVMKTAGAEYREDDRGIIMIGAKTPSVVVKTPITIELNDIPLPQALETLFKGAGLNYTLDSNIGRLRVTAKLSNVPFDSALELLTRSTGLTYLVDGGVYKISAISPAVGAPEPGIGTDKCTEEITLKNTTADYIMQALGFDFLGRRIPQPAPDPNSPPSSVISPEPGNPFAWVPEGIESVGPCKSEKVLEVVGRRKAVDDLKTTIQGLDVKPRLVRITLDYYELSDELRQQVNTSEVGDIREKLIATGVKPLGEITLTIPDRTRGEATTQSCIQTTDGAGGTRWVRSSCNLAATPRINDDDTIRLSIATSYRDWQWLRDLARYDPRRRDSVATLRVSSGKPCFSGGGGSSVGKWLVEYITATVVD